jgi:hypothetical protein
MPYGREDEGLHLPPIREALNRACPDIKFAVQFSGTLIREESAEPRHGVDQEPAVGGDIVWNIARRMVLEQWHGIWRDITRGESFLLKSSNLKVNVLQLVQYRAGGVE